MITFTLTRTCKTDKFTFGLLKEEKYGFRCATVERKTPQNYSKMTPNMRTKCCLPCGEYSLMLRYDLELAPYFEINVTGVYKKATFNANVPLSAGSIGIGKSHNLTGWCDEGDEVLSKLQDYIRMLLVKGEMPTKPKKGIVRLKIEEAPDMQTVEYEQEEPEEEDFDWDLVSTYE